MNCGAASSGVWDELEGRADYFLTACVLEVQVDEVGLAWGVLKSGGLALLIRLFSFSWWHLTAEDWLKAPCSMVLTTTVRNGSGQQN